jgi:hypothetical protein
MGPISPVNLGSLTGASPLQPTPAASAGTASTGAGGTGAVSSDMSSNAMTLMNVMTGVSQLLEDVGGDLKNDKLLRMMIALLILVTLLNESQDQSGSRSQGLGQPGSGSGGGQPVFEMVSSSTTIAIQQTSITTMVYTAEDTVGSAGENPYTPGGLIDLSI